MHRRDLKLYVEDILESIEAIETYIADTKDFDAFAADRKTYSATIREYIIIGEAIVPWRGYSDHMGYNNAGTYRT